MPAMVRPGTLYFLHIPKTAGSSLSTVLWAGYSPESRLPVHEWQGLVRLDRHTINRHAYFAGHFGTGLYSLLDRPVATVTILRDPFERTASHFEYAIRHPRGRALNLLESMARRVVAHLPTSLFSSLRPLLYRRGLGDERVVAMLQDHQARTLGLDLDLIPFLGRPDGRDFIALLRDGADGVSDDDLFDRARRQLDRCAVVGTVERLDDTMALVADLLGIPSPPTLPRENVARGRTVNDRYRMTLSRFPGIGERIDALTRVDRRVYDHADRLLTARLAARRPQGGVAPPLE